MLSVLGDARIHEITGLWNVELGVLVERSAQSPFWHIGANLVFIGPETGGGGVAGALAPPTFEPEGRRRPPPPNFGLSMSFIFVLFLHMNFGPSQK